MFCVYVVDATIAVCLMYCMYHCSTVHYCSMHLDSAPCPIIELYFLSNTGVYLVDMYSKFLHLCNKCTTLAKPQLSVFSWLRNSEAILYALTLPNCGLVELCSVLQRCRNLL